MSSLPHAPSDRTARRRDAPGPTPNAVRPHEYEADETVDGWRFPVGTVGVAAVPRESPTAVWLEVAEKYPNDWVPDGGRPGRIATAGANVGPCMVWC